MKKYKMAKTKTYTSAVELTKDTWKYTDKTQKELILEELNLDNSWAETKTIRELVKRGGGMIANEIKNLNAKYLKEKGGKVTITWRKN